MTTHPLVTASDSPVQLSEDVFNRTTHVYVDTSAGPVRLDLPERFSSFVGALFVHKVASDTNPITPPLAVGTRGQPARIALTLARRSPSLRWRGHRRRQAHRVGRRRRRAHLACAPSRRRRRHRRAEHQLPLRRHLQPDRGVVTSNNKFAALSDSSSLDAANTVGLAGLITRASGQSLGPSSRVRWLARAPRRQSAAGPASELAPGAGRVVFMRVPLALSYAVGRCR